MTKQEILETESPRWGGKPMNGVGMCLKEVWQDKIETEIQTE